MLSEIANCINTMYDAAPYTAEAAAQYNPVGYGTEWFVCRILFVGTLKIHIYIDVLLVLTAATLQRNVSSSKTS